jgi:ubiquitin C-terminal hydrolase
MHGFYNNGNTCYFNSALQCVLRIHDLSSHILRNNYEKECTFTKLYRELVYVYFNKENFLKINIEPLLHAFQEKFPRFKSLYPHDSQDALFCIIDILEQTYPFTKTLVYGKKTQTTICPSGTTTLEEPFSVLLLNGDKPKVSEMMSTSEKWNVLDNYVDNNGVVHNASTTRDVISEYPKVLFISFDKKVDVVADEINNYELCGSILHHGNQFGGHYNSMIKLSNDWFMQDDEIVSKIDFKEKAPHHVLMYNLKSHP